MVILQLDEQPPLIQAVFAGEIDTVRKLLESKQDVNYQDFEKRSALHASSYRGDAPMTELLIENGARVNTKDCRWVTPLHRACCSGSEETVNILLKNQADTGARDRLWQTPLHVASAYNSIECLQHLLERTQNPNVTDRSGRTALHHAVLNGHNDIVELLISKGCIVNACDKKDCRPIHWAAHKGHTETIELLLQNGADINAKDRNLYTPLHVAAASGSVGVIQTLLTHGANIGAQNAYGNTALHIACLNGHGACAQELIRHDADREICNYRGQTPLHIAAASTHGVHCLNMLVGLEVNINKQSCDGRTALHMTAIHGRFTRSKTLIDSGAIVDSVDKNGCTALHIAAQYGHELLSSTLLVYGANPSKKGYEGRTPLHMCCLSGYIECCRIFIKAGVDLNCKDDLGKTPLHCAAYKGAVECVDLLVSSGSDIKSVDNLGRIPLHYASAQGYFFCVFTLVGTGSNPNAQDNEGCTALHLASAYDIDGKCVNYLLEHKADAKLKDFKGFTAVHYAVAGNNINALRFLLTALGTVPLYGPDMPPTTPLHIAAKNGNMDILDALMPCFPDPNIRNKDGCTPLLLAARQGYSNCVQMLLRFGAKVSICDSVAGLSPVHHSAKNGYVHCLALLVDNAEDKSIINQPDNLQRTALMLAVSNLHIDCVTTLIKSGADPNVLDKDGHSCLFRAVVTGQHSVLHMLLPRSTVVNTPDSNGKTILHVSAAYGKLACTQRILPYMEPSIAKGCDKQNFTALQWACYTGNFECVAHFFKESVFDCLEGNPFSAIHCAASAGSEQCIDLLYKQFGPETVKYKDMKCRTPLHVVAIHGHSDCALYLLNLGAEINVKDEDGRTPLMVAAMNGQIEVMVNLISSKADKTLYDVNGNTALHLACLKKHNHAALLLLDFIDDPNVINMINNERRTPLHISARNGLVNVTRMLIAKGSSVLAVDSTGLTPALSCAPNPSVAQCLAIILASHPIHLQGANCKDILNEVKTLRTSIRSLTPRPKRGKRRHFQTDITMVNNPDKFELEHMFDIKLDKNDTESELKDWMGNVYLKFDVKEENQYIGGPPPKKKHKTRLSSTGTEPETEIASYSCHELHGSQSDMSLALKTIYSEEDYRKLIKRSVDNFRKKQIPSTSQEHIRKFQERQQRAMCSFKYDLENDLDDNEMVVVSPSRSPKATNKKLKNQKIKIDYDFKDHFERCSICKQFNDDLLESNTVREPEIPIEVMRETVNKVLAKKGFSNNRCLYAFLNNSFEINSENAYMIFHGMVSSKCEPYIASVLNLKNGEVEITDSVDSISEEKLMYWLDNTSSTSRTSPKRLSSTRIDEIKIKSPTRFKNERFIAPSTGRMSQLEPKSEPSLRSRGAIPKRRDTKKAKNLIKSNSYEDKLRKDEKKSNRKRMIVSTFVDGSKINSSGENLSSSSSQKSITKSPQIDRELLHKVLTSFHSHPLFINQESNKYFRCYPTYWCVPEIKNKKEKDNNNTGNNTENNSNSNVNLNDNGGGGTTSGRRLAPPRDDTVIYFNERALIDSNESNRSVQGGEDEEDGLEAMECVRNSVDEEQPEVGGNCNQLADATCDLRRKGGVLDMKKGSKQGDVWAHLTEEFLKEKIQEAEEEDQSSTSKKRKLTINLPRIPPTNIPQEANIENNHQNNFEKIEGSQNLNEEKSMDTGNTSNFKEQDDKPLILYKVEGSETIFDTTRDEISDFNSSEAAPSIIKTIKQTKDFHTLTSNSKLNKMEINKKMSELENLCSSVIEMDKNESKSHGSRSKEESNISEDNLSDLFSCKTAPSDVCLESDKIVSENPEPVHEIYENFNTQPSSSHASFQIQPPTPSNFQTGKVTINLETTTSEIISETIEDDDYRKVIGSQSQTLPVGKNPKIDYKQKKNKNYSNLHTGSELRGSKISIDSKKLDVQKKNSKIKPEKDLSKNKKNLEIKINQKLKNDSGLIEKTSSTDRNLSKKSSKTTSEINQYSSMNRKRIENVNVNNNLNKKVLKKLENHNNSVKKPIQKPEQTKIPEKTRSRSVDVATRNKSKNSDFIPPQRQNDSNPILNDLDNNDVNKNLNFSDSNPILIDSDNDIGKKIMRSKNLSDEDETSLNDSLIVHPSVHTGIIDLSEFGLSDNSGEEDDTIAEVQSIEDDTTLYERKEKVVFDFNIGGGKRKIQSLYKSDKKDENEGLKVVDIENDYPGRTKSSKKVLFSDTVVFMDENDKKLNYPESNDSKTILYEEIDPEMIELSIKLPDVSFAEDIINQSGSLQFEMSKPGPSNYYSKMAPPPSLNQTGNKFFEKKEINKKHFLETISIEKLISKDVIPKKPISTTGSTNTEVTESDSNQFFDSKDISRNDSDSNVVLNSKEESDSKEDFDDEPEVSKSIGGVSESNESEVREDSDHFKSVDDENISSDETTEMDTSKYFSPPEIDIEKKKGGCVERNNIDCATLSANEGQAENFNLLTPIEEVSENDTRTTSYEYQDALEQDQRTMSDDNDVDDTTENTGNESIPININSISDADDEISFQNATKPQQTGAKNKGYIYNCISGPSNISTSCTSGSDSMEENLIKTEESEKSLSEEIEEINMDQNRTSCSFMIVDDVIAGPDTVFLAIDPNNICMVQQGIAGAALSAIQSVIITDDCEPEEYGVQMAKRIEISEVSSSIRTFESILDDGTESTNALKIVEITEETQGSVQKVFDNIDQFNIYRSDFNLSETNFNPSMIPSEPPENQPIITEQKNSTPKSYSIASTSSAGSYVISDSDSTSTKPKSNQKSLSDIEEDVDEINTRTSEDEEANSKTNSVSKDRDFESIVDDADEEDEDFSADNKFSKGDNTKNAQNGSNCDGMNKIDYFVGRSEVTSSIPLDVNDNNQTNHISSEDTNELVEMIDGAYGCNFLKKVISDTTLDDEDTMNIEDNLSEDEVVRENLQIEKENVGEDNFKTRNNNNNNNNKTEVNQQDSYSHICPQIKLTQHYIDENHSFSGVDDETEQETGGNSKDGGNDESALEEYLSIEDNIDDSEMNQTKLKLTDSNSSKKSKSKTDDDETMALDEVKRAKSKKSFPSISKIGKKTKKDSNCKIS